MDPRRRFFLTGRSPSAPASGSAAGAPPALPAPGPHWQIHISPACLMRQRVECRSCAEACDTRALRCVPAVGGAQLRIEATACTGCADCVPGCPVQAITLVPPLAPAEGDAALLSTAPPGAAPPNTAAAPDTATSSAEPTPPPPPSRP